MQDYSVTSEVFVCLPDVDLNLFHWKIKWKVDHVHIITKLNMFPVPA